MLLACYVMNVCYWMWVGQPDQTLHSITVIICSFLCGKDSDFDLGINEKLFESNFKVVWRSIELYKECSNIVKMC